jgi:sugar lactone lactonase YvrE
MNRPFWSQAVMVVVCALIGCAEGGSSTEPVQASRARNSSALKQSTRPPKPSRDPEQLHIHVPDFFPEGIAHAADGTFFVGSYSSGKVMRQRPGRSRMESFLPPGPAGRGIAGMKVHDATNTLWVCDLDLNAITPDALKAYDTRTGALKGTFPFPEGGWCNDLTLDPQGNVYVTDSALGIIHRWKRGASQLEPWISDARFIPAPGYPGLNGIAWDDGAIDVVKYDSGELFRVALQSNGSAGAVTRITLDGSIGYPDGIIVYSPGVLLVVENDGGKFMRVDLSGDTGHVTLLATGLDNPTTVALHDGDAFIVESQFDHFFGVDRTPADVPFRVKRLWLRE